MRASPGDHDATCCSPSMTQAPPSRYIRMRSEPRPAGPSPPPSARRPGASSPPARPSPTAEDRRSDLARARHHGREVARISSPAPSRPPLDRRTSPSPRSPACPLSPPPERDTESDPGGRQPRRCAGRVRHLVRPLAPARLLESPALDVVEIGGEVHVPTTTRSAACRARSPGLVQRAAPRSRVPDTGDQIDPGGAFDATLRYPGGQRTLPGSVCACRSPPLSS
jgi:hypothetical protein